MSVPAQHIPGALTAIDPASGAERAAAMAPVRDALERLIKIAGGDTGQSRLVANFLLAWWNATRDGGFDLTDLWNLDHAIADDMIVVFGFVARSRCYPDALGYGADFERMVTDWRPAKRRGASR